MSKAFLIKFKGNLYSFAQRKKYLTHSLFNCIFCKSFLKICPSLKRVHSKMHTTRCRTIKKKKDKYLTNENTYEIIEINDMAEIIYNDCSDQSSLELFKKFLGIGKIKKSKY